MNPDLDEKALVHEAVASSRKLMTLLSENFDSPMDAYLAVVFAAAVLSHGMDLEIDHTLDGIRAAFEDISVVREDKQ